MKKNNFCFIEYNGVAYPSEYESTIKEIAGHLDKENIEDAKSYSLHTEYSYGKRNLDSVLISKYEALAEANKNGVPQLWKSDKWATEFAEFILELTKSRTAPRIIETHPPFNDYADLSGFLDCYKRFESRIHEVYPDTQIFIENRSGALYRGGRFLVSKAEEIVALCERIECDNVNLGVVLDFPQLLTAERIDPLKFKNEKYLNAIESIHPYQKTIKGIHIWGKKKSAKGRWTAHVGTLDTYFGDNDESKNIFISGIERVCDDGRVRFLVPEINSGAEDLASVMSDLFGNEG